MAEIRGRSPSFLVDFYRRSLFSEEVYVYEAPVAVLLDGERLLVRAAEGWVPSASDWAKFKEAMDSVAPGISEMLKNIEDDIPSGRPDASFEEPH